MIWKGRNRAKSQVISPPPLQCVSQAYVFRSFGLPTSKLRPTETTFFEPKDQLKNHFRIKRSTKLAILLGETTDTCDQQ